MITPDGRTATQVIQSGNVYDVYTNTVRGNTGFNSFSTFDVYADTTANLHLADGTGRLINVVRDSSSHIDGVLNSYKDGRIGGDVYFLNPHGIIVGKSGVINVGSISMSTPTAAFVEQLIARDGSISPTATQAVLAGDMPINEKGTISIKGKVNSASTAEIRAGRAEVKGGEINARVKLSEMVNTGGRKVDTQGMSIQDGKLSFGATPAGESKAAEPVAEPEAEPEEEATSRMADISIFADNVLVDGGFLNADSVYIDPDEASLSDTAISGEYTAEARIITIKNVSVKEGEKLTSFTLYGNNELEAGDVSVTISNSNIVADEMNIFATATTDGAEAIVSITGSTLGTSQENAALTIYATSESGNSRVDIQRSTLTADNGVDAAAMSGQGDASLTLDAASSVNTGIVSLAAATVIGNADVGVHGKVSGGSAVTIAATTGYDGSDYTEGQDISKMKLTSEGGGDATVTVDGTVESGGTLTVGAYAVGTSGDATVDISGSLSAMATETKQIGELGLDRTEAETANETDSEDQVNAKNAAYLDRYVKYLKTLPTAEGSTGTIAVEAASNAGDASVSVTQPDFSYKLESSLSASISADAAEAASVMLAGEITSGNISATAKGKTSTLSVSMDGFLEARPHQRFEQDGTVVSLEKANGSISLEAGTHDDDNPDPDAPAPSKRDSVLLEVAGVLTAMRGELDEKGEGGAISLVSSGRLTVDDGALLSASSHSGKGGTIYLDAPEYKILAGTSDFEVTGDSESGGVLLMSYEEVTGDNINNLDDMSASFLSGTFNPSDSNNGGAPKLFAANNPTDDFTDWNVGYHRVRLSGKIKLNKDIDASLSTTAIADNTEIDGGGFSLKLKNNFSHQFNFGALITIGKNVKIKNVKDFTLNWNHEGYMEAILSTYIGSPTRLTVGDNFTVEASGNVAITLSGMYNTYIHFGDNVNIQAGGDVKISAKTWNGMGTNLFSSSTTNLLSKLIHLGPGTNDMPGFNLVSESDLVKFNTEEFFTRLFQTLFGSDEEHYLTKTGENIRRAFSQQFGIRFSYASVTFGNEDLPKTVSSSSISGGNVTIAAESCASVTGRKTTENDCFSLSVGFIYNQSKIDLGNGEMKILAKKNKKGEGGNVSITSTIDSKVSLENVYSSQSDEYSVGVLASVGVNSNTIYIDKAVKITADGDIDIAAKSDIEAKPFMSLSRGTDQEINVANAKDRANNYTAKAGTVITFGANVLVHNSDTTINGTLDSSGGDIKVKSETDIHSTLTMNGSIQNTLGKAKTKEQRKKDAKASSLTTIARALVVLNIPLLGQYGADSWGEPMKMEFGDTLDYPKYWSGTQNDVKETFESLTGFQNQSSQVQETCWDVCMATDVVVAKNNLTFNGTAKAEEGSVELSATSSIEAACGAETSIVGIPVKTAVAGAVAVPVVDGTTVLTIGNSAVITAAKDINVSSSTELPMSLDPIGWRDLVESVKKKGVEKVTGVVKFLQDVAGYWRDYRDNGEFGALDALTSSHASTFMRDTGSKNKDATVAGGDVVVDVRNLDTKTIIQDNAKLKAGGDIKVDSSITGKQATVAGRLPIYLSTKLKSYMSTEQATSGFGASIIVGKKSLNTVTYIGAATLEAEHLNVDATGDVFMLELSAAGTVDAAKNAAQGGINVIWEKKMTVSEISNGASITLHGKKEKDKKSSVTASDTSTLLSITGMLADSKGTVALGAGVAIMVNKAFTAAMLGNNYPINGDYESIWLDNILGDTTKSFTREDLKGRDAAITLNFASDGDFLVKAKDTGLILNVGIAGAIKRESSGNGADIAANVGVIGNTTDTTARQYLVNVISEQGGNDITTEATDNATIVSVAGDAAINSSGKQDTVVGAGAVSAITGTMDTTAYVTDYNTTHVAVIDPETGKQITDGQGKPVFTDSTLGEFKVNSSNDATAVAVDVAVGIGAAKAGIAAGVSVNLLTGNTGSYLTGGSVNAEKVGVTSLTDLTACSVTLGTAIDIDFSRIASKDSSSQAEINPEDVSWLDIEEARKKYRQEQQQNPNKGQNPDEQIKQEVDKQIANQDKQINDIQNDSQVIQDEPPKIQKHPNGIVNEEEKDYAQECREYAEWQASHVDEMHNEWKEKKNALLLSAPGRLGAEGTSFDLGASVAVNQMNMRSSAIVEGCTITTTGELKVTADDKSVITAVSVGAAATNANGTAIAAGGVFSFAIVGSVTEAVIRQGTGRDEKLTIRADSLTLHAIDDHRERVWSFGGGYGSSAGLGLVLSLGSFAGATTMALVENVNAVIQKKVDILSYSNLDATFISIGGSGSSGVASLSGMVNYMNFNNHVVTDINNSILTVVANEGEGDHFRARAVSTRSFIDGVGGLDLRINTDKAGAGVGMVLSLVYVGGNGADDTNLTQLLVSDSIINSVGATVLTADSHSTGTLGVANANVSISSLTNSGFGGIVANGSLALMNDASTTQVDITRTVINKTGPAKQFLPVAWEGEPLPPLPIEEEEIDYSNAVVTTKANSSSCLTLGLGSLAVEIGKGVAMGASVGVLKDQAATLATMTDSTVGEAKDFTLQATGNAELTGIVVGGGASVLATSGGGMTGTIAHKVVAQLAESDVNVEGKLAVKAENTSCVGTDKNGGAKGARFTVANGSLGLFGGSASVDVSIIDVADLVQANAHNVSVTAGEMEVRADEHSYANSITVNLAGGKYVAAAVNVLRPVLRGAAQASVTADKEVLANKKGVGITTTKNKVKDAKGQPTATTGNLTVASTNKQTLSADLWAFAVALNFDFMKGEWYKSIAVAPCVCVNSINMAGSSDSRIQGPLTLNVGGDLNIEADTDRNVTYTAVPVAVAASLLSAAINVDVSSMRISGDTGDLIQQEDDALVKNVLEKLGTELNDVKKLINGANIKKMSKDAQLTISTDVKNAMSDALNSANVIQNPNTSAVLDLGKVVDGTSTKQPGTATVAGNVTIHAKDIITTTPRTVNVTGSMLAIGAHVLSTDVKSTAEAIVKDTMLTATGDITVEAQQEHRDDFVSTGVSVGAISIPVAVYNWDDKSAEKISLEGQTSLTSNQGSINIGTDSFVWEDFRHRSVSAGAVGLAFFFPTFSQQDTNALTIGDKVKITAADKVKIKTYSFSHFDAETTDITLSSGGSLDVNVNGVGLSVNQKLTTGDDVTITGGMVDILQETERHINWHTNHVTGAFGASLSFPFITITDNVDAALTIGNRNTITATSGALTIASDVCSYTDIKFYGVNAAAASLGVSENSFTETIDNKVELKDSVKLWAKDSTVRAKSKHSGEMKGNNIAASGIAVDILNTHNDGNVTSTVAIGDGFEATGVPGADKKPTTGHSLTLEAINENTFLCRGNKVTVGLALVPFSRNAFLTNGESTATITLDGGKIDVEDFTAKATTDVSVKVNQLLVSASITACTNTGAADNKIPQTATVTLGKDDKSLEIKADNVNIIAHNKYLLDRLDEASDSMLHGTGAALAGSVNAVIIDAKSDLTATVTLGEGSKIERHLDTAHYLNRDKYKTLISATNNEESNVSCDIKCFGLLCFMAGKTWDMTNAKAMLDLNGSIDTWGDTELTAYSHTRHIMRNFFQFVGIPISSGFSIRNIITATDVVNIANTVESNGNITIQAGSTKGEYKLVDGAVVLAGDDDTNYTGFSWGEKNYDISNSRTEKVVFKAGARVRAGGELAIYNDSSANTTQQPFDRNKVSNPYAAGATDTGANVTSTVEMAGDVQLYAGLGSAVSMIFHKDPSSRADAPKAALQFTSAQQLFAEQEKVGDLWQMNVTRGLGEKAGGLFDVIQPAGSGGKPILGINNLTLPGMAFRIVSKAENLATFNGKLYSPAKHGLDIFIAADWTGDVETRGVTLQGHETGLIFNFQPADSKICTVDPCAGPELYLAEGVSIRSMAQGNLTLTGTYEFPYSTFLATSDHNLTITGEVRCGNSVFEAGGNFTIDTPTSDYALRSALSMYEGLFKQWEATIPGKVVNYGKEVVANSGVDGSADNDTDGVYKAQDYVAKYDYEQVKKAAADAISGKEAKIDAMGTVTINAKVVDLNGKIYSGYLNSDMRIDPNFRVLTNDGKSITVTDAQALYNKAKDKNAVQTIFKLDGYTGVALVYDASKKEIFLNSYEALEAGITITGNIVNSDPTGNSGLYVAGPGRSVDIDNQSGCTLNVGTVELIKNSGTAGITLNNTYTKRSTTYTLNGNRWEKREYDLEQGTDGTWVQKTCLSTTQVNPSDGIMYNGLSPMQVKLQRDMKIGITEHGRLSHGGDIGDVPDFFEKYKVSETDTAALIGKKGKEKHTIVDGININNSAGALQPTSPLTATYVAKDAAHADGDAFSNHSLTDKKITALNNPNISARWQYQMTYDELVTNTLYVSAANDVAINLGSAGSGGLGIKSGNVNFFGNVNAGSCTVEAGNAITAEKTAFINSGIIDMTATAGGIGGKVVDGEKIALAFNAGKASFTAGLDIYLSHVSTTARPDINELVLKTGKSAELRSGGAIKALDLTARDSATIAAQGQINVTAGYIGSEASAYPARISLSSQNGGISVSGGDFTRGIFTVKAEKNVSINSTAAGNLTLDYVESRAGNVDIAAKGNIFSVCGTDMSNPDPSFEAPMEALAEDFYQQMLDYETKYYAKDANGKYINRTADGILALPEKEEIKTMETLAEAFTTLYNSGRGDELGDVMLYLSGTDAVEKTVFNDTADALAYLAQHADKLESVFVRAYYDKMMVDITNEVRLMHGPEKDINYGQFDESVYRLYWLTDCNGKPVYRDSKGNFISPVMEDSGQAVYSPEMCEAITKQFRGQAARGGNVPYRVEDSALFKALTGTANGSQANMHRLGKMEDGLGSLVGGQAIGDMQATVSAKQGTVSLTAGNGLGDIGGGTFHFTIKPIKPEKVDGKFVYSNWAQTVIDSATRHIWPGIVSASPVNKATGEYEITLSYIEFPLGGFNKVNDAFMQRALPMDVEWMPGYDVYRVYLRNYVGVDAQAIKAMGKSVLLATNRDITLGNGDISAENLFLSTTRSLSGGVENTVSGFINLYADEGIGTADSSFRIGGEATFTLGSTGDVYVKPTTKDVKVGSISGKRVVVDCSSGSLSPILKKTVQPNIIGQRIDFYGDLDTGLSFRTTGTSREEGGLHWYGGSSGTLKFNALNTAYTFWFVREDGAPNPGQVDIGYSGHLYIVNLASANVHPLLRASAKSGGAPALAAPPAMGGGSDAIAASFHQIKAKGTGSILEFEGDQTFGSLSLDGEGAYTVLAPGELLLGSSLSVGGNATLSFAGLGSTQGDAVGINSTGNLALASCEVKNDLVVNGTGNVSLADVRLAGEASIAGDTVSLNGTSGAQKLVLSGSNGVSGKDVSSSEIVANSSHAGVFLNSTSTNSLSGSSHKSFVASVRPMDGSAGVTVGNVSANGATSKVIIQAIADQLVLDGYISGAALEFYSTGAIDEETGAMLLSLYPFWDVWQSGDPEVWNLAIETLESDLREGYIWLVEEVESLAEKSCDSVDELRRKVNAGGQPHSAAPLRFTDGKGNTVSRDQFANLITSK
ncbi:MAG: leukotoxin LktA family filamentous adhesin [Akkermansia sp.]|nr:leukotoxin LktA family filamentous adhesin [Akkermansia sp.]